MKKCVFGGGALLLTALLVWWVRTEPAPAVPPEETAKAGDAPIAAVSPADRRSGAPDGRGRSADIRAAAVTATDPEASGGDAAKTPEELKEEAAEAAVESFDALTDKWMEPAEKGVTMADVDAFVSQFKKVPGDRQAECLQRALNLVPDENVMLLAGVLMDKSQPKELVELVFNDVLNRDEDVKKPILQQVFKDKTHPCWADTAWILDVTGEKPQGGRAQR